MANKEVDIKKEFVGITLVLQQKVFMLKTEERLFSFTFFSPNQKVVLQCCIATLKGEKPLVSINVFVCRELYKWGRCGGECLSQVHWWFTRMTSWLSLSPVFVCFPCQIRCTDRGTIRHNSWHSMCPQNVIRTTFNVWLNTQLYNKCIFSWEDADGCWLCLGKLWFNVITC